MSNFQSLFHRSFLGHNQWLRMANLLTFGILKKYEWSTNANAIP